MGNGTFSFSFLSRVAVLDGHLRGERSFQGAAFSFALPNGKLSQLIWRPFVIGAFSRSSSDTASVGVHASRRVGSDKGTFMFVCIKVLLLAPTEVSLD